MEGFDRDLRWRTGVTIVPVRCTSATGFQITLQALEDAFAEAEAANVRVRGLLLTNPSNPLGKTITRATLEVIVSFVVRKSIHLISDEIYSGSVFSPEEFTSVAEIAAGARERVHVVYSLSKDLGLPGFRVGVVYSHNEAVVKTARRMSSFTLVSSQTQKLLAAVLSEGGFAENYVRTNRERLRKRCEFMVQGLKKAGVECLQGNAGLFCWVNMKPLLEEDTREGEVRLWNALLRESKVNISPGSSCHCEEAGWFRVCFANMNLETLRVALKRIEDFVAEKKKL
ncbi:Aminotransferase [Canna indica]|uniref:Aminotransferase n=1 Tax=Canna indica TaxID=4628 RepID=A0AAQ3JX37_9LILI|nr:Aminotransferase [Canna indica]